MAQPKLRFKREDGTEFPKWEENRIVDITSKIFDIDHYMPESVTNGVPYIMTSDLVGHSNKIDFDRCKKVSYEDYCKLSKKGKTEKGDIIFARYATIGTVRLVETDRDFLVSYSCVTIKALKSKLFNDFLYQYFCSSQFEKNIKIKINTGTQGNIGIDVLKQHKLLLPCLEEQQKVAGFLSAVDKVIAQSEEEVWNLEQQKKAAMQKIFSQEMRFRREDGTEFPKWVTKLFSDISVPFKKRNKGCLNLEIYSINNQVGFIPQEEQFEDAGYLNDTDTSIYMIVPPNHFAYNPARINVGSIGYQNVGYDVQVSSLYEVFATTNECDDGFIWHWFHTPLFNKMVMKYGEGGVRVYYYYDKLCETPIMLPCLEEQQKIADFLSAYDNTISYANQELDKWKELKKGLLQQLFV